MKKPPQPDKRQRSLLAFFARPNGETDLEPAGEPAKDTTRAAMDCDPAVTMEVNAENAAPTADEAPAAPADAAPPSPPSTSKPAQQEALEPSPPKEEATAASPIAKQEEEEEKEEAPPAEPATAPTPVAAKPRAQGGLTEYELEREERIRRNMEVMQSLGLGVGGDAALPIANKGKAQRRGGSGGGGQRKRPKDKAPTEPLRKSRRLQGSGATGGNGDTSTAAAAAAAAQEIEEEEEELQFDDSSVQRYVCEVLAAGPGDGEPVEGRWSGPPPAGTSIRGFSRLPGLLVDSALSRAYSVDWRPGLVAAAGKDGHAAVWGSAALENGGCDEDPEVLPLLSYKLHKGWISDVQLWGGGGGNAPGEVLLLSAANDGVVALWDVGKSAHNRMPKPLARAEDLHAGGIFSMHAAAGRIATGSKDCSVVVSTLDSGRNAFSVVHRYDDLHDGVVKCVRWRPCGTDCAGSGGESNVFGSCGNDRAVRVVDVREDSASTTGGLVIEEAHSTAINCLRWSPADANLLLTASNDPTLLLHDLRNTSHPLHTFMGHVTKPRAKGIYQPAFVAGGAAVAAAADPADRLSLYSVADGRTVSRGEVDLAVGATFAGEGACAPLLVTANRCVAMLAPRWEAA